MCNYSYIIIVLSIANETEVRQHHSQVAELWHYKPFHCYSAKYPEISSRTRLSAVPEFKAGENSQAEQHSNDEVIVLIDQFIFWLFLGGGWHHSCPWYLISASLGEQPGVTKVTPCRTAESAERVSIAKYQLKITHKEE